MNFEMRNPGRCQKCQKPPKYPSGTFGTPSVNVFGIITRPHHMDVEKLTDSLNAPVQGTGADGLKLAMAVLWERRDECPRAVPILVAHDEVVVECEAERAADVKVWLEKAMIDGMDTVVNGTDERQVPVELEARVARGWGGS